MDVSKTTFHKHACQCHHGTSPCHLPPMFFFILLLAYSLSEHVLFHVVPMDCLQTPVNDMIIHSHPKPCSDLAPLFFTGILSSTAYRRCSLAWLLLSTRCCTIAERRGRTI